MPELSRLFFADDNYFFFRADAGEAQQVKYYLLKYEKAFGKRINFDKSSIKFSSNVRGQNKLLISNLLVVPLEVANGKYIGYLTKWEKTRKKRSPILRNEFVADCEIGIKGYFQGLVNKFFSNLSFKPSLHTL